MRLFLVDDNASFRENLKTFIEGFLGHQIVGESSDGKEFVENYSSQADIILMDINMPGMDGLKAAKLSTWNDRELKIIAVSQYSTMADLQQLIEVGFKGFVSKTNLFEDLPKALDTVKKGGFFFPENISLTLN